MKTDWNVIRGMMNAAINACERIEASGYAETDRDATINVGGQQVSVRDMLVSAWTYPENLRYQIIRQRHEKKGSICLTCQKPPVSCWQCPRLQLNW